MKAFRTLFVVAALLSAGMLRAQIEDTPAMSVKIPFAFTVENTRLPAGLYIVSVIEHDHLWRLSTADHKTGVLFHISADQVNTMDDEGSLLVFNHYPTDYVLHEIHDQSCNTIAKVYEGKRGKQLASLSASELAMIKVKAF